MEASRRLRTYAVEDDRSEEAGDEVAPAQVAFVKSAYYDVTNAIEDVNKCLRTIAKDGGIEVPDVETASFGALGSVFFPAISSALQSLHLLLAAVQGLSTSPKQVEEIVQKASALATQLAFIGEKIAYLFPSTSTFFSTITTAMSYLMKARSASPELITIFVRSGVNRLSDAIGNLIQLIEPGYKVVNIGFDESETQLIVRPSPNESKTRLLDPRFRVPDEVGRHLSAVAPRLSYASFGHNLLPTIKENHADGLGISFVLPIGILFLYLIKMLCHGSKRL